MCISSEPTNEQTMEGFYVEEAVLGTGGPISKWQDNAKRKLCRLQSLCLMMEALQCNNYY